MKGMIENYWKVSFRNLIRMRFYTLINIFGLALGMTIALLIGFYILHEFRYDKFHEGYERIFRVATKGDLSGQYFHVPMSSAPMGPALQLKYDDIQYATRLLKVRQKVMTESLGNSHYENSLLYADSSFFQVFDFELVAGDPAKVLSKPYQVVITQRAAQKYFKGAPVLGQEVVFNKNNVYTISGIVKDPPSYSHIDFDFLLSFGSLAEQPDLYELNTWTTFAYHTYIKFKKDALPNRYNMLLEVFFERQSGYDLQAENIRIIPYLQPLSSIHLYSHLSDELESSGSIAIIFVLLVVVLFILGIACFNYINLATAKSSTRAREVAVRKLVGASRKQLIGQFLSEALILVFFSGLIALFAAELLLPSFNKLANTSLVFEGFLKAQMLALWVAFLLFIGLLAGAYPAFFLSSYRPIDVLKGQIWELRRKKSFRSSLVVFQFSVAVVLIIATGMVYRQLDFVRTQNLGFEKDHTVVIPLMDSSIAQRSYELRNALKALDGVLHVTASSNIPGHGLSAQGYTPEGSEGKTLLIFSFRADSDYVEAMGLNLTKGRNITKALRDSNAVLVNQTLVHKLGWQDPLGRKLMQPGKSYHIVGVFQDMHFNSLHQAVEPMMIMPLQEQVTYMSVRLDPEKEERTLQAISNLWAQFDNRYPFQYSLLEEVYSRLYSSELKVGRMLLGFTLLAVFIACMGLLGLSAFITEQRTKEIGIRKAMGASVWNIVLKLTYDFAKWVFVANLIGWPIAYWSLSRWLEDFQYQATMPVWLFLNAALITFFVSIATVNYQALKTAFMDPVIVLRDE
jgi:putative ABC transport system permease protein